MKEKNYVDTALVIANIVLFIAFVAILIWVVNKPSWMASVLVPMFFIASWALGTASQVRAENRLDEVELAAVRFGGRWGLPAGVIFVLVLTFLPPFQALLTELSGVFARTSGYPRPVEQRMFFFAVICTFAAQGIFSYALAAAWKWSKR